MELLASRTVRYMILDLYISGQFTKRIEHRQVNQHGGFNNSIQYFNSLYGLKSKKWYVLVFNNKGRFKELYCPIYENIPKYITVPSIFPENA